MMFLCLKVVKYQPTVTYSIEAKILTSFNAFVFSFADSSPILTYGLFLRTKILSTYLFKGVFLVITFPSDLKDLAICTVT